MQKTLSQTLFLVVVLYLGTIAASTANAIECIDEDNCSKQIKKLKQFARYGSPHAQILLGTLYYEGELVKRNLKMSYRLYQRAAKQHPVIGLANHKLALAFLDGKGTQKNIKKALHYLHTAAKANYVNSQVLLGVLYFEGKQTAKDLEKARHFFNLASQNNEPSAQYMLGQMAEYGVGGIKDIDTARKMYSLAANNSYEKAILKLKNNPLFSFDASLINEIVKESVVKTKTVNMNNPNDISKGDVMIIYSNDLPVIEMMDIALANIKDMNVYTSSWTGSHIPGRGCGDGLNRCSFNLSNNYHTGLYNGPNLILHR